MSKESRRRQRASGQAPASGPEPARAASAPAGPAGPVASERGRTSSRVDRVGRRERARASVRPSFIERYRSLLLGAAVVAIVAIVGAGVISVATQPAYACSTIWQPDPTATPGEGASPQPGYVQPDLGQGHVATGTQLTYTYCPPASGRHYNQPAAPITARVYGPGDGVIPQGWIHNLEHGGLVILYRDETADQAALRAAFDAVGPSPICGFQPGGQSPDRSWPASPTWPRRTRCWSGVGYLPLETLDVPAILEFYATYGERTNPEKLCDPSPSPSAPTSPSPAPSASGSAGPSASAAPSGSVAPSPSAAPSAAPSASAS